MVDTFIQDLKDAVWDAKESPAGKGTMVSLYGAYKVVNDDLYDYRSASVIGFGPLALLCRGLFLSAYLSPLFRPTLGRMLTTFPVMQAWVTQVRSARRW